MKHSSTRTQPRGSDRPRQNAQVTTKISAAEMLKHAGEAAGFLKALANEQRLCILCTLLDKPLSVGDLNEEVDLSQSALSQHLAVLREGGLVEAERLGQTIMYSVPEGEVRRVLAVLHDIFCVR
jgi:ArsR family transcriptional regulator, virulence genes transcriptional regulator